MKDKHQADTATHTGDPAVICRDKQVHTVGHTEQTVMRLIMVRRHCNSFAERTASTWGVSATVWHGSYHSHTFTGSQKLMYGCNYLVLLSPHINKKKNDDKRAMDVTISVLPSAQIH